MRSVRLLSWNVHGTPGAPARRQRLARIAAEVLDRAADVVLLQEVWLDGDRASLVEQLARDYAPVDVPAGGWLGRPGGLLAAVRRDGPWRVAAASFRSFRTSAPVWRLWEGDALGRKGVQRIDLRADGERIVVFNTHLQASYPSAAHAAIRHRQLLELLSLAHGVGRRTTLLAAGDLNTRPEDAGYGLIAAGWTDLTAGARAAARAGTCLDRDGSDAGWIDYVLARPADGVRVTVRAADRIMNERPDHPYSDHHGLDVTLTLEAAGAPASAR